MTTRELHGFEFTFLSPREARLTSLLFPTGLEDSIRHALITILSTAAGERPLDPTFGCALHRFMFARIDDALLRDIAAEVRSSVGRCEPRVAITEVVVEREAVDPRQIDIHVQYRIRTTGVAQSITLPMSLVD